jgi:hypothetical protein
MKSNLARFAAITLLAFTVSVACAQNYSVDWYKISGGGGTSSGGNFSVSGTIGQHDAGNALTGGNFSLTSGYWSLSAVQTPGLPSLSIRSVAPNSVVVSWANTGSYVLQTNNDLTTTNWLGYGGTILSGNGTNNVTISPPVGNLFFRLYHP